MCTNFLLAVPTVPAVQGNPTQFISTRCMELTGGLATNLYLVPAQQTFPIVANQSKGWTGSYGFVGLGDPQSMAKTPCFVDGINEVGLSCAALWLPGTQYPSSASSNPLEFCDIAAWAMSQFATVTEVVAALADVNVIGPAVGVQGYLPLHFIATDATGASVVIEFIGGAMNVYPPDYANGATSDGVLTNAPPYDWQRVNLSSYVHLSVEGAGTSISNDSGPPVGSGLLGLPGDIMSASRFVKAATFRQGFGLLPDDGAGWLPTPATAGATGSTQTIVNVALQMVQMIQATPYGTALLSPTHPSLPQQPHPHLKARAPSVGDWTMWQVARDHTNFVYYYSTAFNSIVQKVDLASVDFGGGSVAADALKSIQVMPASSAWYNDASSSFT